MIRPDRTERSGREGTLKIEEESEEKEGQKKSGRQRGGIYSITRLKAREPGPPSTAQSPKREGCRVSRVEGLRGSREGGGRGIWEPVRVQKVQKVQECSNWREEGDQKGGGIGMESLRRSKTRKKGRMGTKRSLFFVSGRKKRKIIRIIRKSSNQVIK